MYPPSEKLWVDSYVERGDETVGFVCQADNREQLRILGLRHALVARRSAVRSYTVPTAVRGAYRDVQELLGQRIERSGTHDFLDVGPDTLEAPRVVREDLPEIVDPVGLAGRHDVVVDLPHFRCCYAVFDRLSPGAHTAPRSARCRGIFLSETNGPLASAVCTTCGTSSNGPRRPTRSSLRRDFEAT